MGVGSSSNNSSSRSRVGSLDADGNPIFSSQAELHEQQQAYLQHEMMYQEQQGGGGVGQQHGQGQYHVDYEHDQHNQHDDNQHHQHNDGDHPLPNLDASGDHNQALLEQHYIDPPPAPQLPYSQFPTLPADLTLQRLIADGLNPDLAFVPYQMRRERTPNESALERAQRPHRVVRTSNPWSIHQVSTRTREGIRLLAHTDPATGKQLQSLTFTFDATRPVRVSTHFLVQEVKDEGKSLLPAAPSSVNSFHYDRPSSLTSCGGSAIPSQTFASPGRHTYTSPLTHTVDFTGLNEYHLTCNPRKRYAPLVVVLEELDAAGCDRNQPRVVEYTTYYSIIYLATSNTSTSPRSQQQSQFTLKLSRSTVRLMPHDRMFEIQEIYGLKGDDEKEEERKEEAEAAAARSGATSPTICLPPGSSTSPAVPVLDLSSVAECIVCMSEPRDTVIIPCRHACVCHDCASVLKETQPARCPVCRSNLEATVRITVGSPSSSSAAASSAVEREDPF